MPDIWNGRPLPERNRAYTQIHCRLYDRHTGDLLYVMTTNSLTNIIDAAVRTQRKNPTAQVYAVEFDGPAY